LAHTLLQQFTQHDKRALARAISMVENESAGYEDLLKALPNRHTPVVGITGPPGAGKSTLISALTQHMLSIGKKVAIIAVDPSSPFNRGALMGDRVRMSDHFLHADVFIRSMASRGSLGGLSPKILEVTDVLKGAWFDYIIIETVGVGQSEVEIASLADTTILALVPEAGDDIQTIKSGVMEIADIYVLNKSDRDGANTFFKNLTMLAHSHATVEWETPVVRTVATKNEGLDLLLKAIEDHLKSNDHSSRKAVLVAEKALSLIKNMRTKDISFAQLVNEITIGMEDQNFNLYRYVSKFTKG
jgi:LAO/AO transport system kinase